MKSSLILLFMIIMTTTISNQNKSIYDFKTDNIDGEEISLSEYEGKVVLIVNVASKCGFTSQYEGLQNVFEKYKEKDFVILGFPANNFKGQEPGTDEEIKKFCQTEYGVEFPMFSKVSVKGEDQVELFTYLTEQPNPDFTGDIEWNFEKFLVNKEGILVRRFRSGVKPESNELIAAIENEL